MKIYLVGGAVRDEALSLPVHERDWVVVGGTPAQLLALGYKQVGRDFPVFLHPKTREEYALARTERKLAPGYHGFVCDFNPQVTLEEDLARRDLTINAMAKDEQGLLIDPYHGMRDLAEKKLHHVSCAFVEDPVRVLRVARFAARYHYLGFTVVNETRALMYAMVKRHELMHVTVERVWKEWQHALMTRHPAIFIEVLRTSGALAVLLPELNALFGVPNGEIGLTPDTGMAMLQRLARTAEVSSDPMIRFAALLIDLGKAQTPVRDWPVHQGHETVGVLMIQALCERLKIPHAYRELAVLSARFHAIIQQSIFLDASTIVQVLEQTDAFRRRPRFDALLTVCDAYTYQTPQRTYWLDWLDVCNGLDIKKLLVECRGDAIKHALRTRRVAAVELKLNK